MKWVVKCLKAIGKFLIWCLKLIWKLAVLIVVFLVLMYIGLLIWYPKTEFDLDSPGSKGVYSPPLRVLDTEEKYPYGFSAQFTTRTLSSYYQDVLTIFYARKRCKTLYMQEIKYEYEGKSGVFRRNRTFTLEFEDNSWTSSDELNSQSEFYRMDSDYQSDFYRTNYIRCLPDINFHNIFKGKKIGDKFDFKLIFVFNVDDDPVVFQTIDYEVTVYEGEPNFLSFLLL